MQVLAAMPWEETDAKDEAALLVGCEVRSCTVFQRTETQEDLYVLLELFKPPRDKPSGSDGSDTSRLNDGEVGLTSRLRKKRRKMPPSKSTAASNSEFKVLVEANSTLDFDDEMAGHYIMHALLTEAETGIVVDDFPCPAKIQSIARVCRTEENRKWLSAGSLMTCGCQVLGLMFTLTVAEGIEGKAITKHIILHCWEQCQPLPFCGDPNTPKYCHVDVRLVVPDGERVGCTSSADDSVRTASLSDGDVHICVKHGQRSAFLSSNFIGTMGGSFWPFDASGLLVLDKKRLNIPKRTWALLRKYSLGEGLCSQAPLLAFREACAEERNSSILWLDLTNAVSDIFPNYDRITQLLDALASKSSGINPRWAIAFGRYDNYQEVRALSDKMLVSSEINSLSTNASPRCILPQLIFPLTDARAVLRKVMSTFGMSVAMPEELSVRYTIGGLCLVGEGGRRRLEEVLNNMYQSNVRVGCPGGSLGYHLVTSSRGLCVITLHGRVDDLIADLSKHFSFPWVAPLQQLIRAGRLNDALTSSNELASNFGPRSGDVMSLRVKHPSCEAALACAFALKGEIPYDREACALYPVRYGHHGTSCLPMAIAIISDILKTIKQLRRDPSSCDSLPNFKSSLRLVDINELL